MRRLWGLFGASMKEAGKALTSVPKETKRAVYQKQYTDAGLTNQFTPEALKKSQASVRVYANDLYINNTIKPCHSLSLNRALTKTAAVAVHGDRHGLFQDGTPFPNDQQYFTQLKSGDPRGLSPEERLLAGKKIIASNSLVLATGGYPFMNPKQLLKKPMEIGIFSQAGAQFEMPYLHYQLFVLDPHQSSLPPTPFSHFYTGLPTTYSEANHAFDLNHFNPNFSLLRQGFSFLSRRTTGDFYQSFYKKDALILLNKAYQKHLFEDTALMLAAVNEFAKEQGKPAFLKATAVGMGFFAKIDCTYTIQHHLYPYYLRSFRDLLKTGQYPHIAKIEFPTLSEPLEELYKYIMTEETYGGVDVAKSMRDVLTFTDKEQEQFYICVVNPSDANALPGNEWSYGSVEPMIGLNTSLRADQVYLMNENVLSPEHQRMVHIDTETYKTDIRTIELTEQPSTPHP